MVDLPLLPARDNTSCSLGGSFRHTPLKNTPLLHEGRQGTYRPSTYLYVIKYLPTYLVRYVCTYEGRAPMTQPARGCERRNTTSSIETNAFICDRSPYGRRERERETRRAGRGLDRFALTLTLLLTSLSFSFISSHISSHISSSIHTRTHQIYVCLPPSLPTYGVG